MSREARGAPLLRVPLALGEADAYALPAETAIYVTRVHRLGEGDRFLAFDPERAIEAEAELVEVSKKGARARLGPRRPASVRAPRAVTLLQGLGKGDKMDAIARDATELGATRIVPVICARSVSRPDPGKAERWRRIAVEAARQSGRGDVPAVDDPIALGALLARPLDPDTCAFCLDPKADRALGPMLAALDPGAPLAFLVGPEGGLSDEEIEAAEARGFSRARLGALVLRTETVCAAVLGGLLLLDPGAAPAGVHRPTP
ncbi:MAG: RsmE family RNA methyltransferase [Byssovorax sp.]